MENFSVFDIIGPRMTGPSSSHTAGAARLGYIARRIIGAELDRVHFTLYGSFAETGRGHGTDKALIAGILGCEPDDARIRSAYKLARDSGVQVEFTWSDEPVEHPNTVRIEAVDVNGKETEVVGVSVGGGNILITEINHLAVEVTGDYPTLIIQHHDMPGVISDVCRVLAQLGVNIAYMKVFRHGRGDDDAFMCIESDEPVTPDMQQILLRLCPAVRELMVI
ncbi:MAG: L-serine ammonia-lyase, iron-sulfur-dependent subunit beta [Clostridiales bacterium]|nr:L-serine ammonia-lyase, iron-sulfur-dependent subunit beta [Clostridiales bacterium]